MRSDLFEVIIESLIQEKDYVSVSSLAEKFKVSDKTIRNYLSSKKMREILGVCEIEKKQNCGIRIIANETQLSKLKRSLEYIKNKRIQKTDILEKEYVIYILKSLLSADKPYTIQFFAGALYKSINSVMKDISEVKGWISNKNIRLETKENVGIWIEGDEREIRKAFKSLSIQYIYDKNDKCKKDEFTSEDYIKIKALFNDLNIENIIKSIRTVEVILNNKFTTNDFNNLLLKISILVTRIRINKSIKNIDNKLFDTKEFLAAQLLKLNLEDSFNIKINKDELNEITTYILAARQQLYSTNDSSQLSDVLSVANKFLENVSDNIGIELNYDSDLVNSLLLHLKPAIRRIKLGAKAENPLLEQIRYQYTDIYIAVLTSIEIIEKEQGVEFDVSEIGYICLHIAAAVYRKENGSYIKTALICNSGITISKYLESSIQNKIKDIKIDKVLVSEEVTTNLLKSYDLIIDSSGILDNLENVIRINELFDEDDYIRVKHWILQKHLYKLNINKKEKHILTGKIFLYDESLDNYESILIKYGNILERKEYVKRGFTESLLDRERKASTVVGRMVAVPHGYNEFVITSSLTIIRLNKPIQWGDQMVNVVFIFTPKPGENKSNKYFFRNLYGVIRDKEKLDKIKEAIDVIEIEKLIIN